MRWLGILMLVWAVGPACANNTEVDTARACLVHASVTEIQRYVEPSAQTFAADEPVKVLAIFGLGGSEKSPEVSCSLTLRDSALTLSTELTYSDPAPLEVTLPLAYDMTAACTSPPLAAGSYTWSYRGETLEFDVPGTFETPCIPTP